MNCPNLPVFPGLTRDPASLGELRVDPRWTPDQVRGDGLGGRALRLVPALALAALTLGACTQERPQGFAATFPPPLPVEEIIAPADGSIFSTRVGYSPLHYGMRAARVGDIVQVVLTERTSAGKTTEASSNREGEISISPPALGPFSFDPGNLNSGSGASFNGAGDATQTNTLRGDIAVTIAEVLPGGMARIRGEKLMRLSQGEEWIQLSGLIRLADVDADNRIASTRIADADIAYGGRGHIQRSSQPGWLNQFFTMVSPF
jgi:flagellar L-ring protein precursor FlgH